MSNPSPTPESPGKRDLFATLRHDLRTPINHILGYSELIREELIDSGNDAFDADLSKIKQSAETLLALVNTHLSPEGIKALDQGLPEKRRSIAHSTPATAHDEDPLAAIAGKILVVDDNAENRDTLCRRLRRQGHSTAEATNGLEAIEALEKDSFDLVLLDVLMPEMDGYSALVEMKKRPKLKEVPVIMISALDELESVVRCIEAGAEDYLSKPFQPTLLRARIGASLEKKALRDQERSYIQTIEETQKRLGKELDEAGNYVRSILPEPVEAPLKVDWRFIPSTELGGDSFGYHWLDEDHFAIYLLDVCGHGVGAALLSVAAINLLRSGSLAADFRNPEEVLALLNNTFPMERHNNMYFTIWYGVYHRPTRTLNHASGGHPAAFLLPPDGSLQQLRAPGLVVGVMPNITYKSEKTFIPEGSRLFVMSDGTYEIRHNEKMLEYEEFTRFFFENGRSPDALTCLVNWVSELKGPGPLDDDFSIVSIDF